jgi:hypothetical protein
MAAYPTFAFGGSAHIPFTETVEYKNIANKQPHGWQYSYNLRANPLRRFDITHLIDATDLATLETFWATHKGAWATFTFTHPDTGVTYSNCRFGMEALDIEGFEPGIFRVRVVIQEHA